MPVDRPSVLADHLGMSIWKHAEFLPALPAAAQITLGEGETPLLHSRRIGPSVGLQRLYLKMETGNPTGSYKDRFAVTAVADMLARGVRTCLGTSSGNAGAALSAYCAAAGIGCCIAVADGAPRNKLKQMAAYGATIFSVRGFAIDPSVTQAVMERLRGLADRRPVALHISAYKFSPAGMSGVETLAYELNDQLGGRVDHVFCQAGGGGMALAAARGFELLRRRGLLNGTPRVECVQPEGNDTISGPLRRGEPRARGTQSTTSISGLQVAAVVDGDAVIDACRRCGGTGHLVSDQEVYAAQARLAREEGIFSEPAGAVALAGALAAARNGYLAADAVVVCPVTGIGFKDDRSVEQMVAGFACPMLETPDEIDRIVPAQ